MFGASSTGWAGGASSAALGGISAGSWKGAQNGALNGALFWGAGSVAEAYKLREGGLAVAGLHAGAGCAAAALTGGDCAQSALSAGFANYAGGNMGSWGSKGADFVRQMVLGGTASVVGGGTFQNGAITAAYAYMYNQLAHRGNSADSRLKAALAQLAPENIPLGVDVNANIERSQSMSDNRRSCSTSRTA